MGRAQQRFGDRTPRRSRGRQNVCRRGRRHGLFIPGVQHSGQPIQGVFLVAGAGHGQYIGAADHLRLKAASPQVCRALCADLQ